MEALKLQEPWPIRSERYGPDVEDFEKFATEKMGLDEDFFYRDENKDYLKEEAELLVKSWYYGWSYGYLTRDDEGAAS